MTIWSDRIILFFSCRPTPSIPNIAVWKSSVQSIFERHQDYVHEHTQHGFWAIATPGAPATILCDSMQQFTGTATFQPDGIILATGNRNDLLTFRILPSIDNLDRLVQQGCEHLRDFLRTNPKISPDDRALCDTIPPLPYSE